MANKIGRNEPCPCGSGIKYKRCHALKKEAPEVMSRRKAKLLIWGPLLFAAALLTGALATSVGTKGRVWSAEHNHWHEVDENGKELADVARPVPQPPGAAPAGKIWSAEHGHWHDAAAPTDEGKASEAAN